VKAAEKKKTIIFFGNSITAGYRLQLSEAFPALIQQKIDSMNFPYKVVNAGISGETTAGGRIRIDQVLKQPVDIFMLELGANDGFRGMPVSETQDNLQAIIDRVKKKNPSAKIVIAGMQMPSYMGKKYTTEFKNIFPHLAQKNNIAIIPFILEGVGGRTDLNFEDGVHPTAAGHRIIAQNVWNILQELL
jgi:acyl-CoA thioesterase-1